MKLKLVKIHFAIINLDVVGKFGIINKFRKDGEKTAKKRRNS